MANDNKYVRLYPERAVAPIRDALKGIIADGPGLGATTSVAVAMEALQDLERLGFPPDEPLLLLRGQDTLAPDTVRFYAERVYRAGAFGGKGSPQFNNALVHLEAHADAMERWQPRKLPD